MSQRPFEYACHEGHYGMVGILLAGRAEDKAIEEAAKKGITLAPRRPGTDRSGKGPGNEGSRTNRRVATRWFEARLRYTGAKSTMSAPSSTVRTSHTFVTSACLENGFWRKCAASFSSRTFTSHA